MPGAKVTGSIQCLAVHGTQTLHGSFGQGDLDDAVVAVFPVIAGHLPLLRAEPRIIDHGKRTANPDRDLGRCRIAIRMVVIASEPIPPGNNRLLVLLMVLDRRRRRGWCWLDDLDVGTVLGVRIGRRPAAVRVARRVASFLDLDRVVHGQDVAIEDVVHSVGKNVIYLSPLGSLGEELEAEVRHRPEADGDAEEHDEHASDHRKRVLDLQAVRLDVADARDNQEQSETKGDQCVQDAVFHLSDLLSLLCQPPEGG